MAARAWLRLRGQAPPAPAQAPRPEAQAEPRPAAPPVRPAFGRGFTFRPTVVSGQPETILPPPRPAPVTKPPSPPPPAQPSPPPPPPVLLPPAAASPPPRVVPSPPPMTSRQRTPSPPAPAADTYRSPTASPIAKTSSPPPVRKSPAPSRASLSPTASQPSAAHSPFHSPYRMGSGPPTHPPSPFTLPPLQNSNEANEIPEVAEPKTVVMQEPVGKPRIVSFFKTPGESQYASSATDARKPSIPGTHDKERIKGGEKKKVSSSDSDQDSGVRIITIAGENKGATMELGNSSPSWTNREFFKKIGLKGDSEGGEEENSKKLHKEKGKSQKLPVKAFVNSNVQGVNNSILYNCSCSHNDPGVHLALTRKPTKSGHAFGFKQQYEDDGGHHHYTG